MSNTQKRIEFIQKFAVFTTVAEALSIDFIIACFFRDREEQRESFLEGKSELDGYEKRSAHQDWLAIDLYIIKDGKIVLERTEDYELLGYIWKQLGGIWGGDWKSLNDIYHFQYGEN